MVTLGRSFVKHWQGDAIFSSHAFTLRWKPTVLTVEDGTGPLSVATLIPGEAAYEHGGRSNTPAARVERRPVKC